LRAIRLLCFLAGLVVPGIAATVTAETVPRDECVVLLHGMARTSNSMNDMAEAIAARGYVVINADYPSRENPVEELAPMAIGGALDRCRRSGASQVHFVTHSLGGILVRYYLKRFPLPVLGRVVMLSPPNQGSEAADQLADWPAYRWLNGPAGQQLVTGPRGLPQRLGPVDFSLGIITGNRHAFFDAWLAEMFPARMTARYRSSVPGSRACMISSCCLMRIRTS